MMISRTRDAAADKLLAVRKFYNGEMNQCLTQFIHLAVPFILPLLYISKIQMIILLAVLATS